MQNWQPIHFFHFYSGGALMTTMSSAPARAKNDKGGKGKPAELPVKIRQTKMLINGV